MIAFASLEEGAAKVGELVRSAPHIRKLDRTSRMKILELISNVDTVMPK
jgi:hypothetical protein